MNAEPGANKKAIWSGACKDGYAEGEGTLAWYVDEQKVVQYEGGMQRGRRQGRGYQTDTVAGQHEGIFQDGEMEGLGIFVDVDGSRYDGNWKAGKYDGAGSMIFSTGGRYDGLWKNGLFHGRGRLTYPDGRSMEGEFRAGIVANKALAAPPATGKQYTLNENTGPSARRSEIARSSRVPFNKPYGAMTVEEQQGVRRRYGALRDSDEPPYPLLGTREMFSQLSSMHAHLNTNGVLSMHVMVEASGKASGIKVFASPSPDVTKIASYVAITQVYKPALCDGTPCAMIYPINVAFTDD